MTAFAHVSTVAAPAAHSPTHAIFPAASTRTLPGVGSPVGSNSVPVSITPAVPFVLTTHGDVAAGASAPPSFAVTPGGNDEPSSLQAISDSAAAKGAKRRIPWC